MKGKKLYRSRKNKGFTGLCGGLAAYLHIPPTIIRVALILITWFVTMWTIPIYIVASIIVPKEPLEEAPVFEEGLREVTDLDTGMAEATGTEVLAEVSVEETPAESALADISVEEAPTESALADIPAEEVSEEAVEVYEVDAEEVSEPIDEEKTEE